MALCCLRIFSFLFSWSKDMPITLGDTTITGLGVGGLPAGTVNATTLAAGAARTNFGAGAVLQVVSTTKTDAFSTTSTSPTDITGLSATITPSSASSKILVLGSMLGGSSSASFSSMLLVRGTTEIFIGDAASTRPRATGFFYVEGNQGAMFTNAPIVLDSPATTSAVTYKFQLRVGSGGGTVTLNRSPRDSDSTTFDMRTASSITLMEIAG